MCRYFLLRPQISPIIRVGEVPGSNPGAPMSESPVSTGDSLGPAALRVLFGFYPCGSAAAFTRTGHHGVLLLALM